MNIVYTINGEGMGHAARSSVVIDYLRERGHSIFILSSGDRPLKFLREKYGFATEVTGMHMVYKDNAVRRLRTALLVLSKATGFKKDFSVIRRSLSEFKPDIVISDFDFHGSIVANLFKIPLVSIDNVQVVTQAKLKIGPENFLDYALNVAVARFMVSRADYYFITTFFDVAQKKQTRPGTVSFVPPLIRKKILETKPRNDGHILVYQTSQSYTSLLDILSSVDAQFIVYNANGLPQGNNITVREFSEAGLIEDLASARAVVVNGGFNVITESIYLRKPILSVPVRHHFEQYLNAQYVENLGYGLAVRHLTRPTLERFIGSIDSYTEKLQNVHFDFKKFFQQLDEALSSLRPRR